MPAPDLELAQLQDMQVNAVAGGGLSLMLAEVLPMAGRVSEWVSRLEILQRPVVLSR